VQSPKSGATAYNNPPLEMKVELLSVAALACLLAACGNSPDTQTPEKVQTLVIGADEPEATVTSLYQMPTPNELFSLVRALGTEGNKRAMNPASNVEKYVTLKSRAFNFGVYSTDLVYASHYKLNVEVARYYLTAKKLADGLGIASAFSDADFVRLEANLTRGDSLELISNDAYTKAYNKLQEEKMGSMLAMVLAGGWVESMHLMTDQMQPKGNNDGLRKRIAEQKVTLEQLIEMMNEHDADADVASLQKELLNIREIYDQVNVQRVAHKGASTSGRMILGDDVTMDMTEEKYQALVQAVQSLRDRMITPQDKTNA